MIVERCGVELIDANECLFVGMLEKEMDYTIDERII